MPIYRLQAAEASCSGECLDSPAPVQWGDGPLPASLQRLD